MKRVKRLPNPADSTRIRPGQRRLIFAVAGQIGLRDEQLHDLVECASGHRTRAIAQLTVSEARRLTGIVKTMERHAARNPQGPARVVDVSDEVLARAVRQSVPAPHERLSA